MQATFSKLRELAHSGLAIINGLGLTWGAVFSALDGIGVHVANPTVNHDLLIASSIFLAVSKGIDSANNAIKAHAPAQLGTKSGK